MKSRIRAPQLKLLLAISTAVCASSGLAATPPDNQPEQDDGLSSSAPPAASRPLTNNLSYGARIDAEFIHEDNYDLDGTTADDRKVFTPKASLAFSYHPAGSVSAYTNLELQDTYADEDIPQDHPTSLKVDKLYVDYAPQDARYLVRFGRQPFKDSREWLMDEDMDGLKVQYRKQDWIVDAAAARETAFDGDLLEPERHKRSDFYYVRAEKRKDKDNHTAAYLMHQHDIDRKETPTWVGVQTERECGKKVDCWGEVAFVNGKDGNKTIKGHALDVGAVFRLHDKPRVYASVGFAHGSGNKDPDKGFRQTGLQGNSAKLGGISRIKYYGETFDPELNNMNIVSAGIGMRPTEQSSIDLVAHKYRQQFASDELRDSDFDREPNGQSRDLGTEVDVVYAQKLGENAKFEAAAGHFEPGDAFGADAKGANLVRAEFRYNFQ